MKLLINLYGVPSAGKSTGAAYIFSKLKMLGVNAELVAEYAKEKVWEESKEVFNNQAYIFGKQYFRISRIEEKVDVIVTDSPLLLSIFYNKNPVLDKEFNDLVRVISNHYPSYNYLLSRAKPYNPAGRFQTEEESNNLVPIMEDFLNSNNVRYDRVNGDIAGYDVIVDDIMKFLSQQKYK